VDWRDIVRWFFTGWAVVIALCVALGFLIALIALVVGILRSG